MTYGTLIQTINLGAQAASITFSSIPQTYTDLVVVMSLRAISTGTSRDVQLVPNSSSAFNCRQMVMIGSTGNVSGSAQGLNDYINVGKCTAFDSPANSFGNAVTVITDYATTNPKRFSTNSTSVSGVSTSWSYMSISAGLTSATGAITSILVNVFQTQLAQNSSISLYGVLKGSGGATVSP